MSRIADQELSESEEQFLFEEVEVDLKNDPLHGRMFILDSGDIESVSAQGIEATLTNIDSICGSYGLNLVIIDYAQMLGRAAGLGSAADGYYQSGQAARWAKNLAMRFAGRGITVILLAQFSRSKHTEAIENDGTYDLSAFAESSEIERAADYAVSIFYDREQKSRSQAKMQLLKNRDRETIDEPFEVLADPDHVYVGDFNDSDPETTKSILVVAGAVFDRGELINR